MDLISSRQKDVDNLVPLSIKAFAKIKWALTWIQKQIIEKKK